MNIKKFLFIDPKNGKASVSLTMMLLSFLIVLIAAGLDMSGKVKGTSVILEIFWGTTALYFGRKLNFSKEKSVEKEGNE